MIPHVDKHRCIAYHDDDEQRQMQVTLNDLCMHTYLTAHYITYVKVSIRIILHVSILSTSIYPADTCYSNPSLFSFDLFFPV